MHPRELFREKIGVSSYNIPWMEFLTILALAFGLAMDAVAVSLTAGATVRRLTLAYALKIALLFGVFQAVMPVLGWLVGAGFHSLIESFDHWIAFILLCIIGGRMIYHDFAAAENGAAEDLTGEQKGLTALVVLSVATSIDAAVAGLGLVVYDSIAKPALLIGITTFALSLAAVYIGQNFRRLATKRINTVGGLILIAIGTKILIEHLTA